MMIDEPSWTEVAKRAWLEARRIDADVKFLAQDLCRAITHDEMNRVAHLTQHLKETDSIRRSAGTRHREHERELICVGMARRRPRIVRHGVELSISDPGLKDHRSAG